MATSASPTSSKLNPDVAAYVPATQQVPERPTRVESGINIRGQRYQYNADCNPDEKFLGQVINLTPHAVNYFKGDCSVFSLRANNEDLVKMFRPSASAVSYRHGGYDSVDIYHDSIYDDIDPERAGKINRFFRGLSGLRGGEVTLIMSTISAKSLIASEKKGIITFPPRLTLLAPKTSLSVRDEKGNIIGVAGFTVVWHRGAVVPRA